MDHPRYPGEKLGENQARRIWESVDGTKAIAPRTPDVENYPELAALWAEAQNRRYVHPDTPEPPEYIVLTKKIKQTVRDTARELGMLHSTAVLLHGNTATDTPGVLYALRRSADNPQRRDLGFRDWEANTAAKIGETTDPRARYSAPELAEMGVYMEVVANATQIQLRDMLQPAALRAHHAQYGVYPEFNYAANQGLGLR
jgi:murein L,D-transpeptidase YcbB/YkuD